MIDKDYLDSLTPVDIEYLSEYLMDKLGKKLIESENSDNYSEDVDCCPRCGSHKIIGWGSKPKQRYKCKDCKRTFSKTTGTVFFCSRLSYSEWSKFIMAELQGATLKYEMAMLGTSIATVFLMRHKLYEAVSQFGENTLSGLIEADFAYKRISFCGTKTKNMPRKSHKRGKHKSEKGCGYHNGNYTDKVCITSAVDENDNCLLKVTSQKRENIDDFKIFNEYFTKGSTVVCDSNANFIKFLKDNEFVPDVVKPKPTYNNYISENGNSLSSVNQLHQSLSEMVSRTHGVSLRHLQGYLNWIVFKRHMSFKVDKAFWKSESYRKVMKGKSTVGAATIHRKPFPISFEYDTDITIFDMA